MALLHLSPKFLTVFAGVPIDEETTRIYVRSSQRILTLPILGWIFTKLKHWLDMAALWQDEKPLLSVRPVNADDIKGEVLLEIDEHIAEYRKMRQRLSNKIN